MDDEIEENEMISHIQNIFNMTNNNNKIESIIEAARILCDLTNNNNNLLQQILIDQGCLTIIKNLLFSNNELAQQFAMTSLSNLEANLYQHLIIEEQGLLEIILNFCCDGPFQSAEIRRSAIFIFTSICTDFTSQVLKNLGKNNLYNFINNIDNINDEKIKVHAYRAKESLSRNIIFAS